MKIKKINIINRIVFKCDFNFIICTSFCFNYNRSFTAFPPEKIILFRIRSYSKRCDSKFSTSVSLTWGTAIKPEDIFRLPKPNIRCDDGSGQGPTGFNIWCDGSVDFRFMDVLNISYGFIRFVSHPPPPNPIGFTYTTGGVVPLNTAVPVSTFVTLVYADDCSGTYYCTPPYPTLLMSIQYSGNGIDWININVYT